MNQKNLEEKEYENEKETKKVEDNKEDDVDKTAI